MSDEKWDDVHSGPDFEEIEEWIYLEMKHTGVERCCAAAELADRVMMSIDYPEDDTDPLNEVMSDRFDVAMHLFTVVLEPLVAHLKARDPHLEVDEWDLAEQFLEGVRTFHGVTVDEHGHIESDVKAIPHLRLVN